MNTHTISINIYTTAINTHKHKHISKFYSELNIVKKLKKINKLTYLKLIL